MKKRDSNKENLGLKGLGARVRARIATLWCQNGLAGRACMSATMGSLAWLRWVCVRGKPRRRASAT